MVALRIKVFVVEQNCPYLELDGKDKVAFHLLLKSEENDLVGTARILPQGVSYPEIAIGRVVIDEKYRYLKLGHRLMKEALAFIQRHYGEENVKLSAQTHLVEFYTSHGFVSTGKTYVEDNIPHTEMILKIK